MIGSCAKRQPRGVFTVAGDPEIYKDGRRDLRLSIKEHFVEHVQSYRKTAVDAFDRTFAHFADSTIVLSVLVKWISRSFRIEVDSRSL